MFRHFWRVIAGLTVLVSLCLSAPVQSQQLKKLSVTLSDEAFYFVLQYIADGAGYFKEEGLDVDVVRTSSGSRQVAILMGGSADATMVNMAVTLTAAAKGAPLVNIANVYSKMPLVLVLSNEAMEKTGITPDMAIDEKAKRLKGLRIGITSPGSGTDQVIRTVLLTRGIDPDSAISLQPLGQGAAMLAALERHSIDGFVFAAPFTQTVEAKKLGKIVINPFLDEVPEFKGVSYMGVAATREALSQKKDQLRALVRAYAKALKLAQQNPAEARRVARKVFPNIDDEVYTRSLNEALLGLPTSVNLTEDQVNRTVTLMNLTSKDKIHVKYSDVVYPDFAQAASKEILGK